VPIVPVAIEGFYEAWPRNRKFRGFVPLKIVFGDPISPPPESEASEQAYEKLTADLKGRIVEMWEELRNPTAAINSGAGARGLAPEGSAESAQNQ
jgi:1-acyl-sn-glycerol-3-phosphate acyltransferase